MTFGEFIKARRLSLGLTLRDFCKKNSYDAGYISRLENNVFLPPEESERFNKLVEALNIKKGSSEWEELNDLALIAKKQLPKDLNQKVISYLPAFFRKASKKEIKKEDVDKLLKLIKGK